jgi:hypothetical protein
VRANRRWVVARSIRRRYGPATRLHRPTAFVGEDDAVGIVGVPLDAELALMV